MWNFLLALFAGTTVGTTRTARRSIKPIVSILAIGFLIAGVIYACVVFKAVSERSQHPHVHAHSTH